ncbi:hypothetical protein D9758_008227 [Tetrapyrgos nigripes]|uniref:Uncharacterized protein n=1 Tax=Tetrapyrgos nigripes TaxID=182062 RepID=A0A8H5G1H1_9AGAR|nr:hypothetical protein D9758_008227 [Tetrapyrgos nigripes]
MRLSYSTSATTTSLHIIMTWIWIVSLFFQPITVYASANANAARTDAEHLQAERLQQPQPQPRPQLSSQLQARQLPRSPGNGTEENHLVCEPFGICEPCPPDALHEPFCQPFGNRVLMHCRNSTSSLSTYNKDASSHVHPQPPHPPNDNHNAKLFQDSQLLEGEIPAWGACGRIVSQERADFYEFVACNVFLAVAAILVVLLRSRRLHALQARQLAARIGLIRGGGGAGAGLGSGRR